MRRRPERHLWLWGSTAALLAGFAVLARRTAVQGTPLVPPTGGGHDALTPGDVSAAAPLVSIILPARDEERNVRDCVGSLLAQDYPDFELIVVDDASRDATPRILEQLRRRHPRAERLQVVRLDDLPAGWAGKPHALHTGASRARGEWLLFTDADTRHGPAALRTAIAHASAQRLDLLSLVTRQDLPDFWGRVLMPIAFMGISALYPPGAVNDATSDIAIANGQYILIRRRVYEALGGYDTPRLRGTVLDDRDLAQEVKRAGYRLEVADGRCLVLTRMYHGLGEHWQGWGKNAYAGSRGGPIAYVAMALSLLLSATVPYALLAAGLLRRRSAWTAAGALQVAAVTAYQARIDRALDVPRRFALSYPLGGSVFTGILAFAGWRKLTGRGVRWRDRTYTI